MPDDWNFDAPARRQNRDHDVPVITYVLIAVSILMTAAYLTGDATGVPLVWHRLYLFANAGSPENVWDGHLWVMLTAVFVHGSPLHIIFNMYWLYQLGMLMERSLRPLPYLALIAASCIVSGGCEMLWSGDLGIGFSGVVYAMFGFAWMGRYRHLDWQPITSPPNQRIMVIWAFGCWIATYFHLMAIANGAHFGGLAFGLSLGWLIYGRRLRPLALVPLGALVALTVMACVWVPWSADSNFNRGNQLFDKHKYLSAIAYYERSIKLGGDKDDAVANISAAYNNLAIDYYKHNDEVDGDKYMKLSNQVQKP